MALFDIQLKKAKPRAKAYKLTDGDGLYAEVLPSGKVSWRFQYYFAGRREKVVLGPYLRCPWLKPDIDTAMLRPKFSLALVPRQTSAGRRPRPRWAQRCSSSRKPGSPRTKSATSGGSISSLG